jgi:hypothetical protein
MSLEVGGRWKNVCDQCGGEGMRRVTLGSGDLAKQEGRGGPMRVQMQVQMRVLYLPSTVAADAQ